jgi:hypothetical protein
MPPKKEKPTVFNKNHFNETIGFLILLILIGALISRLEFSFNLAVLRGWWDGFFGFLLGLWGVIRILAAVVIGLCAWWVVYSRMKLHNIEKEQEKIYGAAADTSALSDLSVAPHAKVNEKWTRVIEHLNSTNPSDWRLAIIEADIMLDELLTSLRYHGDSIGEKLKAVEPSDMKTLDAAWEAHKVRNRIAHAGSDFELNEREAKRVIALFESVFKEYQII